MLFSWLIEKLVMKMVLLQKDPSVLKVSEQVLATQTMDYLLWKAIQMEAQEEAHKPSQQQVEYKD